MPMRESVMRLLRIVTSALLIPSLSARTWMPASQKPLISNPSMTTSWRPRTRKAVEMTTGQPFSGGTMRTGPGASPVDVPVGSARITIGQLGDSVTADAELDVALRVEARAHADDVALNGCSAGARR